jgi:hypothetical protein
MKKTNCCCKGELIGINATHSKKECNDSIDTSKVSKLSTTFIHHETKIKAEVDEDTKRLTLINGQTNRHNRDERNSFVFIDSKPETILKVANALLDIVKAIK